MESIFRNFVEGTKSIIMNIKNSYNADNTEDVSEIQELAIIGESLQNEDIPDLGAAYSEIFGFSSTPKRLEKGVYLIENSSPEIVHSAILFEQNTDFYDYVWKVKYELDRKKDLIGTAMKLNIIPYSQFKESGFEEPEIEQEGHSSFFDDSDSEDEEEEEEEEYERYEDDEKGSDDDAVQAISKLSNGEVRSELEEIQIMEEQFGSQLRDAEETTQADDESDTQLPYRDTIRNRSRKSKFINKMIGSIENENTKKDSSVQQNKNYTKSLDINNNNNGNIIQREENLADAIKNRPNNFFVCEEIILYLSYNYHRREILK